MRDIPMFTTDFGVASLSLGEVTYRREAYVTVLAAEAGQEAKLLEECAAFCRMAGAEKVYARGSGAERYPLFTAVYRMRGTAWVDPEKLESLFPVTPATAGRWRELYREKMAGVDNAASLEEKDEAALCRGGYFVHRNGELLGIGWLEEPKLLAMAAVQPGAGERVLHSLMSLVEGAELELEVASTNRKALRLYERNGFLKVAEVTRWYRLP